MQLISQLLNFALPIDLLNVSLCLCGSLVHFGGSADPLLCLQMDALSLKKMDFSEFCAAAISVHQLEGTDRWEQHARAAFDIFEKEGNRSISVEELARVRISLLFIVHRPSVLL